MGQPARIRITSMSITRLIFVFATIISSGIFAAPSATQPVYVDPDGVIRWSSNNREVSLFGANYCLPSASDYRAAGYVGADRKKLIEQDMAHFARMGFDGLRISFWGDWENSDEKGNLIVNDHLDLMDYLIAQATKRGIYMLFTPITAHSSLWPDLQDDPQVRGFSRHFEKSKLGTDPDAIAVQVNYLQQILNHVNPYSGVAIKDEPNILFIEMINEPWHHSDDYDGSVRYINALVDAVRSAGCSKLTFHNISQDFGMAKSIHDSKVDGSSISWYPSELVSGHELHGNFLPFIDSYPHMTDPPIQTKPTIVYEFDLPDVISGYHYPAMVRTFRQCGAQFAAMFSYDMLATAPNNLGWQTHVLNLVYTPKKAASAIIAGEVMRSLPRRKSFGEFPRNTRFSDFRVSYEQDLAEMVTAEKFMYSNDTVTTPALAHLNRIVGFGSSPVVNYDGRGIYFLDRIDDARWRLEVYPDSVQLSDPFERPSKEKLCYQLVSRKTSMTVRLPGLGDQFLVAPLDEGNAHHTKATGGKFEILPGVYLLTRDAMSDQSLPDQINGVGMREFVCPPALSKAPMKTPTSTRATDNPPRELTLFDAERDQNSLAQTRAGWAKPTLVPGRDPNSQALVVNFPRDARRTPEDFSRSLYIGDRIAPWVDAIRSAQSIAITLKAHSSGSILHLVLVDKDGAAWGTAVAPSPQWQTVTIPLSDFHPTRWALLPQGFPNGISYWANRLDKGRFDVVSIERLQLSLQKADLGEHQAESFGADVQSIALQLHTDDKADGPHR